MKAILMDDQVQVYDSMEEQTISIATLHKGDEMELGKVSQKKKKTWVEVKFPDGRSGYIAGDSKIFAVRKITVSEPSIDLKQTPEESGKVLKTYVKGTPLTVYGVEKPEDGSTWFKVRDEAKIEGFVPASSKMRVIPESTKSSATRNIVTGFIFAAVGVFLTISNYQSETSQNMIWISYAVIFFGLLQLGQGVAEYLRATRGEEKKK